MSTQSGAVNPVSLHEAIQQARRPFTAAAVRWKIQVNPKDDAGERANATIVAFIDARLAGERLNAVGLLWSREYTPVDGGLLCDITAFDAATGQWVTRGDVGWSRDTSSDMTLKTLYSDAFKRAAVCWGVGVSIYALPMRRLYVKDEHVKKYGKNWIITDKGQRALANHYQEWLQQVGIPQFGEPLDHGDVDGAQGDLESTDRQSDERVAKDTPEPKAKAEPKSKPKAEEPKAKDASAPLALMTPEQVKKVIAAVIKGSKTVEDIKTFLASKGVEEVPDFVNQSLEVAYGQLDAEVGKALYVWLRKSAEASS